ncbi:MAG: hypothetical protein ACRDVG_16485 [Jatrophihabitantaceae bacterium]
MSERSKDLAADLLHDLAEQPAPAPAAASPSASRPSAVVETSLFLAPSTWRRPAVSRQDGSLCFAAGPLQIRLGRRADR